MKTKKQETRKPANERHPLCSIGFHSDLANIAWNEIGT